MRQFPSSDDDRADLARLNAEPWMVECLRLNPKYTHWGPHEDYMTAKDAGWREPVFASTWAEFGPWTLSEMNEVVHFYFQVQRASNECEACSGSGLNPATHQISEDFYDFAHTGRRWCDAITQDECDALVKAGRLNDLAGCKWDPEKREMTPPKRIVTAEDVNAANRAGAVGGGFSSGRHDAINRWILIDTRAKRLGVYGKCDVCEGRGYVFTEPAATLGLVLWVLHPRKGAARGVEIKSIGRDDLGAVMQFLSAAAERNAARFAAVVKRASEMA